MSKKRSPADDRLCPSALYSPSHPSPLPTLAQVDDSLTELAAACTILADVFPDNIPVQEIARTARSLSKLDLQGLRSGYTVLAHRVPASPRQPNLSFLPETRRRADPSDNRSNAPRAGRSHRRTR